MKISKKMSILLASLMLFSSFGSSSVTFAQDTTDATVNVELKDELNEKIHDILNKYFEGRFKYQNNLLSTNESLKFIEPQASLYEKTKETDDGIRKAFLEGQESIKEYNINNIIKNIEKTDEGYKIDMTYKTDFYYADEKNKSQIEEDHIIHIKKINNNYLIVADIFDSDQNLDEISDEYISNKNEYEKEQKNETQQIHDNSSAFARELKTENKSGLIVESKQRYLKGRGTYNRSGAQGWALRNALTLKEDFPYDCTNFVSKAMKYGGGMKEDKVWHYHSYAWIRVIELRNWLINRGYAQQKDHYKYADIGDIVQYSNKKGTWKHSVIVTGKTSKYPHIRVSAHTKNRRNVNVSGLYYPRGDFSNYRVLHITR